MSFTQNPTPDFASFHTERMVAAAIYCVTGGHFMHPKATSSIVATWLHAFHGRDATFAYFALMTRHEIPPNIDWQSLIHEEW